VVHLISLSSALVSATLVCMTGPTDDTVALPHGDLVNGVTSMVSGTGARI